MAGTSVSQAAYYLALIGGILMIVLGFLAFAGHSMGFYFHWGFSYGGIITLICGVLAIFGARNVNTLAWAIALIVVGVIGGGLGGLLVLLGGIFGLIAVLSKKV
jgi:hypothetical protein